VTIHLYLFKTILYDSTTTGILALAFAGSLTFFGVVVVPWLFAA
jgi:hypothetical protein